MTHQSLWLHTRCLSELVICKEVKFVASIIGIQSHPRIISKNQKETHDLEIYEN